MALCASPPLAVVYVSVTAMSSMSHPMLARLVPEEPEDVETWLGFESSDAAS
jgi:hypothetical protein